MKKSISLFIFILIGTFVFAQQPERFSDEKEEKKENSNVSAPEEVPEKPAEESAMSAGRTKPPASKKSSSNFVDRLRFGGNLSLGFGTYTYINLSPRVHYLVQDNLGVGTGFSYYYWKDNRDYPANINYKTSGNTWGLNFFSWYNPFGPVTLQAEYEPLNFEVYQGLSQDPNTGDVTYVYGREWVHALFLGGGIYFIMKPTKTNHRQGRLFQPRLSDDLNPQNHLYILSKLIDWEDLENYFSNLFSILYFRPIP